jgi:hypothetical protein
VIDISIPKKKKKSMQRTDIVSSIRMVVNATEESRRRVLSNHLDQKVCPAGVFFDKVAHVVDEAGDENERSLLGLLLDYIGGKAVRMDCKLGEKLVLTALPADHGKVIAVTWPLQRLLGLPQLL